ncbi:MAG: hypothetical protein J0L99_02400 [Chitinophagales bacterium]|nr:hypothetical protein [Chitinophagales bacterium]
MFQKSSRFTFFALLLSLFFMTCKGGCDKKCKDETAKGKFFISTTLISAFDPCAVLEKTMLADFKARGANAFTHQRNAGGKWYIEFDIIGVCDDENGFRYVKVGPTEAKPKEIDGKLFFEIDGIPINKTLTINTTVVSPCTFLPEGSSCCTSDKNGVRRVFMSANGFDSVANEEKLEQFLFEFAPECCSK